MRRAAFLSLEDRPVLNLYNNEMKRLEGAPLGKDPLVIPKNHRMFYTHNYPHSKRHPELLSTYSGSTKVERFHFGIDNNRLQIVDNPEGTQLLLNYYSIMATIIRKPAPETSPNDDEEHEEDELEDEMGEVDPVAAKRRKDRKDIWGRDRSKLSRKVQLPPGMQKLENADWLKMTPQDRLKYFPVPSECYMSGFIISYPYYDHDDNTTNFVLADEKNENRLLCAFSRIILHSPSSKPIPASTLLIPTYLSPKISYILSPMALS